MDTDLVNKDKALAAAEALQAMTPTTEDAVRAYLEAKKATLWADFDLTQPERFDAAVEWLTEQINGVSNALLALYEAQEGVLLTTLEDLAQALGIDLDDLED